jgi:hypothetical protein
VQHFKRGKTLQPKNKDIKNIIYHILSYIIDYHGCFLLEYHDIYSFGIIYQRFDHILRDMICTNMIFSSKQYMGEKRSYRDGGLPIFSRATNIKGDYKPSLVGSVTNEKLEGMNGRPPRES